MTPKRVLEINGDLKESPLIETIRRIHSVFSKNGVSYTIIGGMAVIRNGCSRTTIDIDILTTREGWHSIRNAPEAPFDTWTDHAVDKKNNIDIDVLFPGNDWEMLIPLPHPDMVKEYDEDFGANFIGLKPLLELKTAVYLKKKKEEGIEIAAKDLYDIVELIKKNHSRITDKFMKTMNPVIAGEIRRISARVIKS
ncbi:hypothetical protein ES708_25407 [subsurface metagenome]